MKIFKALASGFCRTLKAWKGILLIWFGSLLTVALIAAPMKGFLKSGFDGSMITERLRDGIDLEVLGDLGSGFRDLLASLPSDLLLLILTGIIINAFFAGGIFDKLKGSSPKFSGSEFFKACAKNFWSFLVISLLLSIIIIILFNLLFTIPLGMVSRGGSGSEKTPFIVVVLTFSLFLLISTWLILVADYSRSWQVANDKVAPFPALGFGFSRTFNKFLSSFPMMLIIYILHILFTLLIIRFIGRWMPGTGGGVFLLFIISQILVFLKAGLKVWRYASVTSLKEINDPVKQEPSFHVL